MDWDNYFYPSPLGRLESRPVSLNKDQSKLIDKLREKIGARLNSLELEGVLELYNNLPATLQKRFLELVTKK